MPVKHKMENKNNDCYHKVLRSSRPEVKRILGEQTIECKPKDKTLEPAEPAESKEADAKTKALLKPPLGSM